MHKHFQKISDCPQYPMNKEQGIAEKFYKINAEEKPYVLVSVNIKNFKYLNLKYGWEQGNEILYLFYLALQRQLTDGEHVAHSAEDNYVLLLHSRELIMTEADTLDYIQVVIMRFIDAVFEIDDERIYKNLYASFGIYPVCLRPCSYYEAYEMSEFFRKSDAGIKFRTFSVNYYQEDVYQKFLRQCELKISTANALQRGEYQVYIQPKVEIKTGKIAGGEALLRRFDGEGKAIPLYEFLPILNSEGYIRKIDWFVFETVCEEIGTRIAEKKPVAPISFNISKDFFYDVYMCDNYIRTYKKYGVPQEYIEFELMETISLDDTGRMVEVIKKFKEAGFACSLDDFGNGYSSFGVLLNADFDYIKLDRIFFTNPLDDANKVIIKGVVDLLKFLGFKIVAEGVETKEYVDYLAEVGCDMIQGYYFYKPMPLGEFMQLLSLQE